MILEIIFSILGIIILIVTGILIYVTRTKGKQIEVLPNMPFIFIDNSRIKFTEGYFSGLLKRVLPRRNKTFYIEFFPTDVTQGENVPRPEIQSLIIAKEFLRFFALGEKSFRRQIIMTISRSQADIPEKLRNTEEGKWESVEGQKAYLEQVFGKAIPLGDEAISELVKDWSRGQLSKAFIKQLEDNAKAGAKIQNIGLEEQKEKKP